MDPWLKIREILEDALELEPAARPAFVAKAAGEDAELKAEIESYLKLEESERPEAALRVVHAALEALGPEDVADPERIGVYRILRRIGEGGMGVVYLAEREDGEFRQQVALKALKPGPQRSLLLKLFRRERQILAQLEHPCIARLLDGGTADGVIFYAMEYVEGRPLAGFCREHGLGVAERLRLFARICEAVSYAHRKLIIHRDLKPENILVTAEGEPKLLDFGLAKAFEETATDGASMTIGPMLTPAYASPEQVRGEHLSTATDIYSLGVILYELLAGGNPQLRAGHTPLEVCRTILEETPPPPSRAAGPQQGRVLRGDLDQIVLMALRKEPERRYGSVDELRADVERYLEGFPVTAARGEVFYRTRKYLLRHRWAVGAAVVVAAAAVVAGVSIWWAGRQAEMRFDQVRRLAHSVIFELHDSIRQVPGTLAARKLIVERGLEYLESLEASRPRERAIQMELAEAYERIAEIQSNNYAGLGDTAGALKNYQAAWRLLETVLRAHPNDVDALRLEGLTLRRMALIHEARNEPALQAEAARLGTAADWQLARATPGVAVNRARALADDADNLSSEGKWEQMQAPLAESLALAEPEMKKHPGDPAVMKVLSSDYEMKGQACNQRNQLDCAVAEFEKATAVREQMLAQTPGNVDTTASLAYGLADLGWMEHRVNRMKQAIADEQRSVDLQLQFAEADPNNWTARAEAAKTLITLALIERDAHDLEASTASLERAAKLFEICARSDPGNQSMLFFEAWTQTELGQDWVLRAGQSRRSSDAVRQMWRHGLAAYEQAEKFLKQFPAGIQISGFLKDDQVRNAVPLGLAECRRHLVVQAH